MGDGREAVERGERSPKTARPPRGENFLLIHPDPRAEKVVKLKLRWAMESLGF